MHSDVHRPASTALRVHIQAQPAPATVVGVLEKVVAQSA